MSEKKNANDFVVREFLIKISTFYFREYEKTYLFGIRLANSYFILIFLKIFIIKKKRRKIRKYFNGIIK